jgi:Transposase DDE domain
MGAMDRPKLALDENWKVLLSLFPKDWMERAWETGAVERLRGFGDEGALMRTLLLHVGRGYSLRETVVRAKATGVAEISDVALLKRLRKSEEWLRSLCVSLLQENGVATVESYRGMNLRAFDATIVSEPGKTGSQWRIHYSLRIPSLRCDFFQVSPSVGEGNGESFTRFPVKANDFILADRGYCSPAGVGHVAKAGAYVLLRVNTGALPLFSASGKAFPLQKELASVQESGEIGEWNVVVHAPKRNVAGRLCVVRKSEQAIQEAIKKLRRQETKQGTRTKPETLEYAKYVLVFTTFPETHTAMQILEWYRLRWQIELAFKRLKSLAQLGHLPKYDEESSRAWLYGKLFVALLTEKLTRIGRDFSPWGYFLEELRAEPMA